MQKTAALVLAAGKGTRMHSDRPKVLQSMLGSPMLAHVLVALGPIFANNIWLVVGHRAELVKNAFPEIDDSHFVHQAEQLGTAHAVACALPALDTAGIDKILIVNGDTPLLDTNTVRDFLEKANGADIAFASITLDDPAAYGRVVRRDGKIAGIVEAKDYDESVYGKASGEVNSGIYLIKTSCLQKLLPEIRNINASGEYYLTDIIDLAIRNKLDLRGIECGNNHSLLGVNSPTELADTEEILRAQTVKNLLGSGTVIHAPELLRVSPHATIEPGVELTGPCEIYGKTIVRRGASIASHCFVRDCVIESGAEIRSFCHLEGAMVGQNTLVGPFARLRPGAEMEESSHVGNFVELKKTRLGKGAKANHLTYLGDSQIGEGSNIGAGTITCNYDGKHKYQTIIGKNSFIGSNTAIVAPVKLGENVLTGAGSVITHDIEDNNMGIARSRQKNLPRRN